MISHSERRAFISDRVCRAITGLDVNAFRRLLENFIWVYDQEMRKRHKANCKIRGFGGGKKGSFASYEDKLLLILFFLKSYPTEEVMGLLFDTHSTTTGSRIRKLLPILELVLGKAQVLPARKISSLKELFKEIPELKEVFIDGVERPIQRKKNKKHSNKNYSGKKKRNTKKNLIISGRGRTKDKREILLITKTRNGRRHEKKIADKERIYQNLPDYVESFQDTGLIGVKKEHSNSYIPKKKTKNNALTEDDKFMNKLISSIRCTVENSIWGIKRFNSVSNIYRHKTKELEDKIIYIASGLWNFHLLHRV